MKKFNNALVLSALLLTLGLASCGPQKTDETFKTTNFVVKNEKTIDLNLPSSLVKTNTSTKYFGVYVVESAGEAGVKLLSNGGDTLMTSGQTAKLYAYDVPTGYSLGVSVTDDLGNPTTDLKVAADGTITAPTVSEKKNFVVTLFAQDPSKTVVNSKGESVPVVIKSKVNVSVVPTDELAAGTVEQYASELNAKQRSVVTAELEKFALKNGLTGISLSDNGGYALYNDRVSAPLLDSNSYLAGYGFGIYDYGKLTKPLSGETTEAFKMYYHSHIQPSQDKNTVNYLNSDQAAVADMYTYMSAGYFKTQLNENYDEYEYVGNLARVDEPIPLNMDEKTGLATKWRIPVWVGGATDNADKGVKAKLGFRTSSSKFSKYDKQYITLEDYLTPFKLLATQSVGWYRGTEQAGEKTANRQIKGFAEFYNSSKDAKTLPTDEEFSKAVGVSLDHETNSVIIEFNAGFTQEFAIYQLDGLWSNPMNEAFITELGGGDVIAGAELYGTAPANMTPADTSLSVGPYYCENYLSGQFITFKKNEDWFITKDSHGRDIFQIAGYHIKPNSALDTDALASVTAWENNLVESCSIIDQVWEKYLNDPRKKSVLGDNQQKFTFNRMDKLLWDQFFGEGGTWSTQFNKGKAGDWEVKPISSNDMFFYALNLGVDRLGFAEKFHRNPSIDYQNPIAKVNPVTGELYNNSPEHKAAIEYVYGNSFDDLSTTTDLAVSYMKVAIEEELAAGHYTLGTEAKPTVVSLGIGSMEDVYFKDRIAVIEENWASEFNTAVLTYKDSEGNNPLIGANKKPLIKFELSKTYVPNETSVKDLIQGGMWTGKFDIQYAYLINGNALDTINNMNILMSDKMGGFELNFAVDTTLPSSDIYYDGKYWSFNSLWSACNGGTVIGENGVEISDVITLTQKSGALSSDGKSATVSFEISQNVEGLTGTVTTDVKPYFLKNDLSSYADCTTCNVKGNVLTVTLPESTLIDGSKVGAEGKTYFEGYVTYLVTGANGKTAQKEAFVSGLL